MTGCQELYETPPLRLELYLIISVGPRPVHIKQNGTEKTVNINWTTHAEHPNNVKKGTTDTITTKKTNDKDKQPRTVTMVISTLSIVSSKASRNRRELALSYDLTAIPMMPKPPSQPKTPCTSVTRIGEGYTNNSPQECRNEYGHFHAGEIRQRLHLCCIERIRCGITF